MDLNGSIFLKIDNDFLTMSSKRFIYCVIDNFPQAVHEAATISRPDIHTGTLTNSIKTFQNGEIFSGICALD